jgi:hypothetical protein
MNMRKQCRRARARLRWRQSNGNSERRIAVGNQSLKLLSEHDDKERSEVVADNTNLPITKSKDQLPARIDPGVDVILRETARANPMLRFKEGEYLVGEDKISLGREYLVHPLDWTRGWVKWEDGIIVDQRMVRVADDIKLPTREELGDNDESLWKEEKDPWVFQNILPMDDLETREYMIFVTSSVGGKVAVETLCNSVVRAYKKGRQFGLPVIGLATKPFPTKFGTKPRPHFPIVRWHDLPQLGEDMSDEVPF